MACHNLTLAGCVLLFAAHDALSAPPRAAIGPPPTAPRISAPLQKYLARVARRTIRDSLLRRDPYVPNYVPAALETKNGEAVVRLWQDGYLQATGAGGPGPIVYCVSQAASVAASALGQSAHTIEPGDVAGMALEIELAGEPVPVPLAGDWTAPAALAGIVEPGAHGVIVIGRTKGRRVYPSEMIWRGVELHEALGDLAKATQTDPKNAEQTPLKYFATVHCVQDRSGADPVRLRRGMVYQDESAITREGLSAAIDGLREFALYRQQPSGVFSYEFLPGADRYALDDSLLHQLAATASLSRCARIKENQPLGAAVRLSLRYHQQGLHSLPGVDGAAFLATAVGGHPLGATALMSLSLANHPRPEDYTVLRGQLVSAMLSLQRESGMFLTAFPPAVKLNDQDYFPGEALLALATEHSLAPSKRIEAGFDRAYSFYRKYFRSHPSPAFAAWQVQAFALMAEQTGREDFAAFVFELADPIAAAQVISAGKRWPELDGAIRFHRNQQVGASTALYLAALCDALRLARARGDGARQQRYEAVVRRAARFVVQLQFRPVEAFFVKSERDVVGGIRTSPALNRLRIDHACYALTALMKARQVLFES